MRGEIGEDFSKIMPVVVLMDVLLVGQRTVHPQNAYGALSNIVDQLHNDDPQPAPRCGHECRYLGHREQRSSDANFYSHITFRTDKAKRQEFINHFREWSECLDKEEGERERAPQHHE